MAESKNSIQSFSKIKTIVNPDKIKSIIIKKEIKQINLNSF